MNLSTKIGWGRLATFFTAMLLCSATVYGQYCTPVYTTGTAEGDQIEGVELEDISNTESGGSISGTGYSDYTGLSTELTNGITYTLTVTNASAYSITITSWIDYNQNEVFETDEVLGNLSLAASASGNIEFTVPITAAGGATRMRVRGIYPSGLATPLDPCSSATYGETEDYTVVLTGGLENNLTMVGISSPVSGADIGFEDVTISLSNTGTAEASGFTVYYNVDGGLVTGELYPGTIAAGETAEYTFSEGWTFEDYGCFDVQAWVEWDLDEFEGDNTFNKTVCNLGPVTGTGAWYINSNVPFGEPWGSTSNIDAMNTVFGVDGWTAGKFEEVDPGIVFSSENCFVFLEGSDQHANELESFLIANIGTIESWVAAGGHLLLNAAPNEGDGMSFGFDGTNLIYSYFTNNAEAADPGHPIFAGPFTPVGTNWTGGSFGHARVEGEGLTNLIWDEFATSNIVLAEKSFGDGIAIFGGMTTNNFHSPLTEAANLRANIIAYLACTAVEICAAPDDVTLDDLTATSATLSWSPVEGADQYVLAIRNNTTGVKATRQLNVTSYTFGSLTPGHSYTFRVKSVCFETLGDISAPSAAVDFTTPLRLGMSDAGMSVYPNPSNGTFRVQLNGYTNADVQLQIVNTLGQVVYANTISVMDDITVEEISLDLQPGTYLVQLISGDEITVNPIIVE